MTQHTVRLCRNGPHMVRKSSTIDGCVTCHELKGLNPLNLPDGDYRDDPSWIHASTKGWMMYAPTHLCPACHTGAIRTVDQSRCEGCETLAERKPSPRQAAIAAGRSWYLPEDPCKHCGEIAERRVSNGECSNCTASGNGHESPRQVALAAGEQWYTPTDPCPRCGTTARRRVNNGECEGCRPNHSPERSQARDAGHRWYMPADSLCPDCGHRSMRNVRTDSCLACRTLGDTTVLIEVVDGEMVWSKVE